MGNPGPAKKLAKTKILADNLLMGLDLNSFTNLMAEQAETFKAIQKLLKALIAAAQEKNGNLISSLTAELINGQQLAEQLDRRMVGLVVAAAEEKKIDPRDFKLSMLDKSKGYLAQVDGLRALVGEVGLLSAKAGGILAANVDVIEQTIKVLESIDARGGGYGPEKAVVRPSKLLDRSA